MRNKFNNKIVKIAIILIIIILLLSSIIFILIQIREKKEYETALTLIDNLNVEYGSDIHVSNLISNLNGTLINDYKIDTGENLGEKEITFEYLCMHNKKRKKSFKITIIDTEKPKVFNQTNSFTFVKGTNKDLTTLFLSGDNCDTNPTRRIIGDYDLNEVNTYNLTFEIEDSSNNKTDVDFTLNIVDKINSKSSTTTNNKINFSDVSKDFSNKEIGIDVSEWQGEIDFQKVKNDGCKFVFIRVGYQKGKNGELYVDKYFEQNIKNALANNLEVGIYFYSCANNYEDTTKQADFVIDKIKDYNFTLPVYFDWESWSYFNEYNVSFYSLNKIADIFISKLKNSGYESGLYSSKYYLEKIWYKENYENAWLAQYNDKATYSGKYEYWQRCNTGRISGINGDVDIDIRE